MYTTVVVGTDGSPTAATAVHHALRLSAACGAKLHLVTAFTHLPLVAHTAMLPSGPVIGDDGSWIPAVHDRFAEEAHRAGVPIVRHVLEGEPATVLIEVARTVGADLLVTGNRGMSGVRGLLGSVPKSLAHHAPCAVLVVPTDRW